MQREESAVGTTTPNIWDEFDGCENKLLTARLKLTVASRRSTASLKEFGNCKKL